MLDETPDLCNAVDSVSLKSYQKAGVPFGADAHEERKTSTMRPVCIARFFGASAGVQNVTIDDGPNALPHFKQLSRSLSSR